MDIKKIGQFIREQRTNRGYTQGQLADLLQVSHQAVSRWENGDNLPDVEKLSELSILFKVSIDEIVSHGMDITPQKQQKTNDLSYYFMIHAIISTISIVVYYALFFATGTLWIPIIVQYVTIMGSSMLYIIPFGKLENKNEQDFKRVKYGIMISIGAFTWTMHTFLVYYTITESVALWLVIEGLLQLILLWSLSVVQANTFNKPFELSKSFSHFILSLIISFLLILVTALTANTLNSLFTWGETHQFIYSGILAVAMIIIIGLCIRQLTKQFDLIILNVLVAFIYVSYQIYYIVFWAMSDYFHYVAIQSARSVEQVYHYMFFWIITLFIFITSTIIVKFLTQKKQFFERWITYISFVTLLIIHELILVSSEVHFDLASTSNNSRRILFNYGAGTIFIALEITFIIYFIWDKIDLRKQKKTSTI